MTMQYLESAASTMDVARENLLLGRVQFDAAGRPSPAGVWVGEQTAGRGQRARTWFSLPGECLCATYYFQHGIVTPASAGQLAFLAGMAVVHALQNLCGAQTGILLPGLRLKWPNDVLLNGKKVGGILIELMQGQQGDWIALIGVGVNIHIKAFPPELTETATSLWHEEVQNVEVAQLAERLAETLNHYADVRREEGFEAILNAWRQYDDTPGRVYETTWQGSRVKGTAEGADDGGALCLRLDDGRLLRVLSASSLLSEP